LAVLQPDYWFLIWLGHKSLGKVRVLRRVPDDLLSHKDRELVDGCCPGGVKWGVLKRWEELIHHFEIRFNEARLKENLRVAGAVAGRPRCREDLNACETGLNYASLKN
jgi:hypothetical protein